MDGRTPTTPTLRKATKRAKPVPGPASAVFEATCPRCGTTAEAPSGATAMRCPRCGQVVEMVDEPLGRLPGNEAGSEAAGNWMAFAVGLLGPVLVAGAFVTAHTAIDRPDPDTGTGGLWFLVTLLLVAAVVFLQFRLLHRHAGRAAWGLFATVPAFFVAMITGTGYDDGGLGLGGALALWAFVAYLVVVGILALAAGDDGRTRSAQVLLVGGAGTCAGIGLAALFLLTTLEDQAENAREAYETPAWGFLLVVGVLLVGALRRRRTP
jgi:hypothetical protein